MSKKGKLKQIRNLSLVVFGFSFLLVLVVLLLPQDKDPHKSKPRQYKNPLPTEDPSFSEEKVRLSHVELETDAIRKELKGIQKQVVDLSEDNTVLERKNKELEKNASKLESKIEELKKEKKKQPKQQETTVVRPEKVSNDIHIWGRDHALHTKNVATTIAAGTVVKCMVVSTAFCGVGVNSASNPRVILLQPVDNGHLPWNIRVALKGSRIICSAVGDLASERAYVRAETLTKMIGKGGDFIETKIAGCVLGDDGAEGIRGVVVDKSGSNIARAAFASVFQGISQGVQSVLNNQTLAKISQVGDAQSILNVDTFRNAGVQGANTAFEKMSDYYIKRAEQLQPVIQITRRPARYVDVLFMSSVKIGETNIKGKIEQERKERQKEW